MTISRELLLAILAMDAYNRGYSSGHDVNGDGLGSENGTRLGTTTVIGASDSSIGSEERSSGFYAIAYDTPYGTVISHRGTDDLVNWTPWSDTPGGDIWNSYSQGLGTPNTNATRLAVEFYQAVTNTTDTDPSTGSAILAGHSMGGGLAGRGSVMAANDNSGSTTRIAA